MHVRSDFDPPVLPSEGQLHHKVPLSIWSAGFLRRSISVAWSGLSGVNSALRFDHTEECVCSHVFQSLILHWNVLLAFLTDCFRCRNWLLSFLSLDYRSAERVAPPRSAFQFSSTESRSLLLSRSTPSSLWSSPHTSPSQRLKTETSWNQNAHIPTSIPSKSVNS